MAISVPTLDDRRYQDLLDEALARVPVHTPEWTHFGKSDPGVTIVELFAFLTESLLYRANQIPERNRLRFLQLLGVGLQPASAARGLAQIRNAKGPLQTLTLAADLELRAGALPFRTTLGLAVLPVEAAVYYKREVTNASQALKDYYAQLYASYGQQMPTSFALYETVPLTGGDGRAVSLGAAGTDPRVDQALDRSLWIALFARPNETPGPDAADPWKAVRNALGGRVLTLGVVPAVDASGRVLEPGTGATTSNGTLLGFEMPRTAGGGRARTGADGVPLREYQSLAAATTDDLLGTPGVVQVTLPAADAIDTWRDFDPLEGGVDDVPPTLEDDALVGRLVSWLRVRCTGALQAKFLWLGINTVPVRQLAHVGAEPLAEGTGQPDQWRQLAHAPVLPASVQVTSFETGNNVRRWQEIDDLVAAGSEVAVPDPRLPPGCTQAALNPVDVFSLDAEAGRLRFGDGLRGRRPAEGARLVARYDWSQGAAGNVAAGAINSSPALPAGYAVTNPVATWGGADAESTEQGEKQIRRFLQHRDRLVTAADFEAIAWRTPGLDIGRVDVLPAYHPDLGGNQPGDAAGVVTLMVIPAHDPAAPNAPQPDPVFLGAMCSYLDARRLVTTELVLRGPHYRGLWISVGIDVVAGFAIADVVEAVKQRLTDFLAPVRAGALPDTTALITAPQQAAADRGWPLRTPVQARVLLAEAARVPGVASVADVLLAEGDGGTKDSIPMQGLDLPMIVGLSVVAGDPLALDVLRGTGSTPTGTSGPRVLPVPVIPERC